MNSSVQLRRFTRVVNGGTPTSDDDNWGGPILWATPEDLGAASGMLLSKTRRTLTAKGVATSNANVVPSQSIVVSIRAPIGHVAVSATPMAFNQGCRALVPRGQTEPRFLFYALSAYREALRQEGRGSTFTEISGQQLASFRIHLPNPRRQRLIADFLDRETHRIDALVDAKRRMIGLLVEKLDARIDRLVAGSGYRKANGWRSSTLGRVATSINDGPFGSSLASKHYTESGVRVVRLGNIGQGHFIPDDKAYISESYAAELDRYSLDTTDVVMAGLGDEQRSIGRACVVPQEALPAIHKADCYRIVPKQFMDPGYLASYLSSTTGAAQGERLSQGTTRRRVNTEIASRFEVPVPPLEEQHSIMKKVTRVRHLIEAVTSRLNRQLDLLAEYRQVLITQAVTGQLDEATLKGDKPVDEAVGVIPE